MSKLKSELFISEAIEKLGFEKKPLQKVIINFINDDSLSIYFDETVEFATQTDHYKFNQSSRDEGEYLLDGEETIPVSGKKKLVEASLISDGSDDLAVYKFKSNDLPYYPSDETGMFLEPFRLKIQSIYFDKQEFDDWVNQDKTDALPCYQDLSNELYAEELDLAIKLHKAIYIDKFGNQNQSRELRVKSWLDKNTDLKMSDALITRLSTIIGTVKKPKK